MIYLEPPGTDPYFNLALEEYVFEQMDRSRAYFMLWQNSNTIVVGKYQNTAEEINQAFVDAHGIRVVRRLSIREQGRAELTCQFCDKVYHYTNEELEGLLASL